jgi:TIR domain
VVIANGLGSTCQGLSIVTGPSHAVVLSYASKDAEAAQRTCEALRAGGIEVFLDESELRGGDVWDWKIRREINDCALFIPVIAANTASRHEGYFRLEWDLADQRTATLLLANKGIAVTRCHRYQLAKTESIRAGNGLLRFPRKEPPPLID